MHLGLAACVLLATSGSGPRLSADDDLDRGRRPALLQVEERLRPGETRARSSRRVELRASAPNDREATAAGPLIPSTQEIGIATSTTSEDLSQLGQATSALADGSFAVTWTTGKYPDHDVYMQWINAQGLPVFPFPGKLVAGAPGDQFDPVVAPHPNAGAFVAFADGPSIRLQYFDASGIAQWPGSGVLVALLGVSAYAINPQVMANPAGGAFVCFQTSDVGPRLDIACQLVDSSGARRWGDAGASVLGAAAGRDLRVVPRILGDGAGGLMVFWRNQRDPFSPGDPGPMLMEGQRLGPDGSRLWGDAPRVVRTTNLASSNGYTYTFFQVVTDGSGGAILAFDDWTGTSDLALDVMAQRVSAAGDPLWGAGVAVAGANGHQQHEQTIAGPNGGVFVAVWDEIAQEHNRLLLFHLSSAGQHLWSPGGILLSDPGATANDYGVDGSFAAGTLLVAWTHQIASYSFAMDVLLSALAPDGTAVGGVTRLPLTTAPDAQFMRKLAHSALTGQTLAVWDDRRKGTWDDMDVYGSLVGPVIVPTVAVSDAAVAESESGTVDAVFTVTLSQPGAQVRVNWATQDGTATGADYVPGSGVLTFAPGTTSQTLRVAVRGDRVFEPDETFLVVLSASVGATLADDQGVGTILNDDPQGLSIADVDVVEPVSGTRSAVFTVTLSPPSASTVTVGYATTGVTASAGSDFTPASGTLTFDPGVSTRSLSVSILADALVEGVETFHVDLSGASGAAIAYGQAAGRIHDPGQFFSVTPCRVLDTRDAAGPHGGPAMAAGESRTFALAGRCGIPTSARAVAVNMTVTQPTAAGNLRLYPAGTTLPNASSINYTAGQTRANNAAVPLNGLGELAIFCAQVSGTADFILDVNGYFE